MDREPFGLEDLRAFVAIVDLGGFNRAADALAVTQSALTRRLQKLEDGLGTRLVDRTTRSVALTEVGRRFLPQARRSLAQFAEAAAEIRDVIALKSGRVSVASLMTAASYLLPKVAARFAARHPEVRVRVFDATGAAIPEHVRRGEAEFAIDMESNEYNRDLKFTPILSDGFVVAARPDGPLAGPLDGPMAEEGPLPWSALAGLPVIALGRISAVGQVLGPHWQAHAAAAGRIEVQHISTLTAFVEAGLGVGVMPALACHSTAPLRYRPLVEPDLRRTIGLIERPGATLSPAAKAFKECVLDVVADLPGTLKAGEAAQPRTGRPETA